MHFHARLQKNLADTEEEIQTVNKKRKHSQVELNKKRKVVDGYWNQDAEGQDGAEWSGLAKGGGSHQENGNGDAMTDD